LILDLCCHGEEGKGNSRGGLTQRKGGADLGVARRTERRRRWPVDGECRRAARSGRASMMGLTLCDRDWVIWVKASGLDQVPEVAAGWA
jgi:hypothetical protein